MLCRSCLRRALSFPSSPASWSGGLAGASRHALLASAPTLSSGTGRSASAGFHSSTVRWSGHNKWSKIRHKKGAMDKERGKIHSYIAREIMVSVRSNGGITDPLINARLAAVLAKAKELSVPKEIAEKAIQKAVSKDDKDRLESVTYEALFGGGTVAMIIECATDSPTRTFSKVREFLNKSGARIAPTSFLFTRTGLVTVSPAPGKTFDDVFALAIEGGAEDVREAASEEDIDEVEEAIEILCSPSDLSSISNLLSSHGHVLHDAAPTYLPNDVLRVRPSPSSPSSSADEAPPTSSNDAAAEDDGTTVDAATVELVDKLADALEDEADMVRMWTNVRGLGR